jgi:hypothetical protein
MRTAALPRIEVRCPWCRRLYCTEHPQTRVTVIKLHTFPPQPEPAGSVTRCRDCKGTFEVRRS